MNNYYKNLCGYANLFTKDPSKSEDIVQNIAVNYGFTEKKSILIFLLRDIYINLFTMNL